MASAVALLMQPSRVRSSLLLLTVILLGGCRTGAPAPVVASPGSAAREGGPATLLPPGFTARDVAEGDSLFNTRSCRRCHGIAGKGTANGPTFLTGTWRHGAGSVDDIARTVESGVPLDSIQDSRFKLDMHPNPSSFTPPQIRSVAAYVWTLSRARTVATTPP